MLVYGALEAAARNPRRTPDDGPDYRNAAGLRLRCAHLPLAPLVIASITRSRLKLPGF